MPAYSRSVGVFRTPWRRYPKRYLPGKASNNVTINVDTPGQITWAGATGITLVATSNAGPIQARRRQRKFRIIRRTQVMAFVPPSSSNVVVDVSIAGQIEWTGQDVNLVTTVTPTAGAITWTGQTVGLTTSIGTAAGAILWTGQALGLKTSVGVVAGAILWNGATDITLQTTGGTTINVDVPGAITWTGQQVGLTYSVAVTPGAVTFAGVQVRLVHTITPTPGAILWAGAQNISLVASGQATPVKGPTRKTVLTGDDNAATDLAGAPRASSTVGDDVDSEELVGAPRAVLIGASRNDVQEV